METMDHFSQEQKVDLLRKIAILLSTALKSLPEGNAALGRACVQSKDGQEVLALMLLMQSRGEI